MVFGIWNSLKQKVNYLLSLLTNPTSFYLALQVLFHFILALTISVFAPIFIKRFILPSAIQENIPLNLEFSTCSDNLHGICSFPTATYKYEKFSLLSSGTMYAMSIRLSFIENDEKRLGLFQNVITVLDENDNVIRQMKKTAHLREPSMFTKSLWWFFFPLYFLGFFKDYRILEVEIANDFVESSVRPSSSIVYSIQDKFAHVEEASLLITAQMGFIRNFIYYWPMTTYLILFASSLTVLILCILLYWGYRGIGLSGEVEHDGEEGKGSPNEVRNHPSPPPADEYIPANVNEVPRCVSVRLGPSVLSDNKGTMRKEGMREHGIGSSPSVDQTDGLRRRKQ